jgi:hypothetical protein
MTITEMFLKGEGGNLARSMLAQTGWMDEEYCATWTSGAVGLARFIAQLLYSFCMKIFVLFLH